jgi:hypothetical protein
MTLYLFLIWDNYWKSQITYDFLPRLLFPCLVILLDFFFCRTYLYSLTKQDVALIDVPGMYEASRPIMHYIKHTIEMYAVKKTVRFDRNQPHVLKYSADDKSKHTGVEVSSKYVTFWLFVAQCIPHILFFCTHKNTTQLHHDKCDVTANIMLSRSNDYTGGGWVKWGRVIFI